MGSAAVVPTKFPRTEFVEGKGPKCRTIIPPAKGGWSEPVIFEWELNAESWSDRHPHSEYNFVVEGQLFVECGGVTVEARAGDVIRTPAGATGRYWAPEYARLVAIYGPSHGEPSDRMAYEKLASD